MCRPRPPRPLSPPAPRPPVRFLQRIAAERNMQGGARMTLRPGAEVASVLVGGDPELVVRHVEEDEHDVDQDQRRGHLPGPPHPARLGRRRRRRDEVDELVERQPAAAAAPLGDHPPDLAVGEPDIGCWCSSERAQ